jgi:hypothetical protein
MSAIGALPIRRPSGPSASFSLRLGTQTKIDELVAALAPTDAADPAEAPSARKRSAPSTADAVSPTAPTLPPTVKVKLAFKREGPAAEAATPPVLRIKVSAGPGDDASSDKSARKRSSPDAAPAPAPASSERKIKLLPPKAELRTAAAAAAAATAAAAEVPPVTAQARHVLDALAKLRDGYKARPCCQRARPRAQSALNASAGGWCSDRAITALFQTLPRRSELPDYYALVQHPISLKEITVCPVLCERRKRASSRPDREGLACSVDLGKTGRVRVAGRVYGRHSADGGQCALL